MGETMFPDARESAPGESGVFGGNRRFPPSRA
jgi:hypothetical protein